MSETNTQLCVDVEILRLAYALIWFNKDIAFQNINKCVQVVIISWLKLSKWNVNKNSSKRWIINYFLYARIIIFYQIWFFENKI